MQKKYTRTITYIMYVLGLKKDVYDMNILQVDVIWVLFAHVQFAKRIYVNVFAESFNAQITVQQTNCNRNHVSMFSFTD